MFILRRITSENYECHQILGQEYAFICKERNAEDFQQVLDKAEFEINAQEKIYGFISYENGSKILPLYKSSNYFIMTSDGWIYSDLTYDKGFVNRPGYMEEKTEDKRYELRENVLSENVDSMKTETKQFPYIHRPSFDAEMIKENKERDAEIN
jgi:hypothetical protein